MVSAPRNGALAGGVTNSAAMKRSFATLLVTAGRLKHFALGSGASDRNQHHYSLFDSGGQFR
jgi:hypothetical protein